MERFPKPQQEIISPDETGTRGQTDVSFRTARLVSCVVGSDLNRCRKHKKVVPCGTSKGCT